MKRTMGMGFAAACLFSSATAVAQEAIPADVTEKKVLAEPKAEAPQGWKYKLSLGATGSYNHSSNVVGSVDGSTVQLGLIVTGAADWTSGAHAWENALKVTETQTRTPTVDPFIKSADELALQTTYLFRIPGYEMIGPFARASLSTQVFESYDVRITDTTVRRIDRDGATSDEVVPAEERIELAKPFEPLLVKESLGAFANPVAKPAITVKTKLGAGLQHIFVRDGYKLQDDGATAELELVQHESSTQGGAEAEAEATGALAENVTYAAKATFFYPLYTSVETDLDGVELLTTDFSAKLSVRLAKWASLADGLAAKKIPLILDEWQVSQGVMLTAGFDLL